jgi:hypothetical protein
MLQRTLTHGCACLHDVVGQRTGFTPLFIAALLVRTLPIFEALPSLRGFATSGDRYYKGRREVGSFSIWHWLIILIITLIFVYPICRIVGKAGFAPAWGLLWFVPLVNIVMLWVFALSEWPVQRRGAPTV